MSSGSSRNLWKAITGALESLLKRVRSFTGGTWLRFLMIPLIALLLWAIAMPVGAALNSLVEYLAKDAPARLDYFVQLLKILVFGLPSPSIPTTPLPAVPPPVLDLSTRFSNWLSELNRDRIQLVLLVGAALWTAYRLMIQFVYYLYEIDDFRHAARMVESAFLPFRRRKAVIQEGKEISNHEISVQEMVGGRSSLTMDAEKGYAAVLERPGSFTRVVGPQDNFPVNLDGFTHLRDVIDLREQIITISAAGHTQEGIPIKAQEGSFSCQLAGSQVNEPQKQFTSCDPASVHTLVYLHWIGQDWYNRHKRRIAIMDLVTTALRKFISERRLVEFLPELDQLEPAGDSARQQPCLLEQFATSFSQNRGEHGLQLVWTGEGTWHLGEDIDLAPIQENGNQAYQNWLKNQPGILTRESIQIRQGERRRLAHHVIRLYDELDQPGQSEEAKMKALTRHYLERLQNAIRMVEARGERPSQAWLDAARHLENLV